MRADDAARRNKDAMFAKFSGIQVVGAVGSAARESNVSK
jgi:hypothetical protein